MRSIVQMYRLYRLVVLATGMVAAFSAAATAKNFISYKGQFHLTYPDSWEQVDYNSVDYFLSRNNSGGALFNYEAVFAPVSEHPFYEEPYLMLTFDSVGSLSGRARDSAVGSIVSGFTNKLDSVGRDGILSSLKADAPLYSADDSMLVIQTDIHEGRTIIRRNLLCVRFTTHGLANFYFYAADSQWVNSLPIFVQMAQSLTAGTIPQNVTRDSVKIADLSREPKSGESTGGIKRYWPIPSGFVIILVLIMVARRRKRARDGASSSN